MELFLWIWSCVKLSQTRPKSLWGLPKQTKKKLASLMIYTAWNIRKKHTHFIRSDGSTVAGTDQRENQASVAGLWGN
jgi:hypothetical protein